MTEASDSYKELPKTEAPISAAIPHATPRSGLIMKHLPLRSTQGSRKPVWKQIFAVMG